MLLILVRWAFKLLRILLGFALITLGIISAAPPLYKAYAFDQGPPLRIDVVVDPVILQFFPEKDEIQARVREIVDRASLIFHSEIGRRLEVGNIWFDAPTPGYATLSAEKTFRWFYRQLKKRKLSVDGPERVAVFLTSRPIFNEHSQVFGEGVAYIGRFVLIVRYSSDITATVVRFLHELGHACGASHATDPTSLMWPELNNATSYKDKAWAIRDTCGPNNSRPFRTEGSSFLISSASIPRGLPDNRFHLNKS